jgi:REP element-mobilizing transposase RayT
VERFGHKLEAFCFMTNHIHLAIRVADITISKIMHHLSFRYTQYINRRYKRIGHLFQGRFKSILVDETKYLKELIRYIHLNPIRANITSDPLRYEWSSHKVYMGIEEILWLSKSDVLQSFHPNHDDAKLNYEKYVLKGIGIETDFDFKAGCIYGILGDDEFIKSTALVLSENQNFKIDINDILLKVCELYSLSKSDICSSGKQPRPSEARAVLSLLVKESNNLTLESLGMILKRDPSGLAKLANRLQEKSNHCVSLQNTLKTLRDYIITNSRGMSECPA